MKQGNRALAIATCLALVASGCAGYRPLVDMRGVDPYRYEADLADCQRYAAGENPGGAAAAGAALGALLGLALAVAAGVSGHGDRGNVAAVGAVSGLASGGAAGIENQIQVINRCMMGRGYNVLR